MAFFDRSLNFEFQPCFSNFLKKSGKVPRLPRPSSSAGSSSRQKYVQIGRKFERSFDLSSSEETRFNGFALAGRRQE
jgi:hypothetical protein